MTDTERFDFLVNFINACQTGAPYTPQQETFFFSTRNLVLSDTDQVRKLIDKANEHVD